MYLWCCDLHTEIFLCKYKIKLKCLWLFCFLLAIYISKLFAHLFVCVLLNPSGNLQFMSGIEYLWSQSNLCFRFVVCCLFLFLFLKFYVTTFRVKKQKQTKNIPSLHVFDGWSVAERSWTLGNQSKSQVPLNMVCVPVTHSKVLADFQNRGEDLAILQQAELNSISLWCGQRNLLWGKFQFTAEPRVVVVLLLLFFLQYQCPEYYSYLREWGVCVQVQLTAGETFQHFTLLVS